MDLSQFRKKNKRRSGIRVDSSKISITDINKLKNLPIMPYVEEGTENNFYIEPVVIEYYIPKESRFAYETKYHYIELYDPKPINETQEKVMGYFINRDEPVDVMVAGEIFPEYDLFIQRSYNIQMDMHLAASKEYKAGLSGENPVAIRRALYLNEVLRKREPNIAALEILGDYTTYNINWCIRFLNKNHVSHSVEDDTVEYLMKLHRMKMEAENRPIDDRFETLSSIYMDQAFPFDEDIFDDEESLV